MIGILARVGKLGSQNFLDRESARRLKGGKKTLKSQLFECALVGATLSQMDGFRGYGDTPSRFFSLVRKPGQDTSVFGFEIGENG